MTCLILLRHAKAISAAPGMRDFDRPLHRRGREECAFIAQELRLRKLNPDHVLCSASLRTRQTLDLAMQGTPFEAEVTYSESLFSADVAGYLGLIKEFSGVERLMVVGHNPSTEELAIQLAARGDRPLLDALMGGFATGCLAHLEFGGAFSALKPRMATLLDFVSPPRG